jgi:hypothetical protein
VHPLTILAASVFAQRQGDDAAHDRDAEQARKSPPLPAPIATGSMPAVHSGRSPDPRIFEEFLG